MGLPLAMAAKKMLQNSPKYGDKQTCQAALHSENLPHATFLAAWAKKLQPLLQSHRENRGAPCAYSLSFKGTLHEPGIKHPSSSSSSWVLKGQWSSWADWCREDTEYNTHFWGYPGRKDSNLEIFENKYHLPHLQKFTLHFVVLISLLLFVSTVGVVAALALADILHWSWYFCFLTSKLQLLLVEFYTSFWMDYLLHLMGFLELSEEDW